MMSVIIAFIKKAVVPYVARVIYRFKYEKSYLHTYHDCLCMNNNVLIPQTISEQLLYSTVRIIGLIDNKPTSFGTGFFYNIKIDDTKQIELILTNKHVIENNSSLSFFLHEATLVNDHLYPAGSSFQITFNDFKTIWIPHPNPDVDLGALLFVPIREQVKNQLNKVPFIQTLDESLIKDDMQLKEQSTVADEVLMVGYPIGLWDEFNNFPIIRKGITATHPAIDFQNKSIGVVDIACFPGSSGSPILICMEGSFSDKLGNLVIGGRKIIFLGLLSSGPTFTSEGKIEIKEIPTVNMQTVSINTQMIHLGYYVKAKEILNLCNHIKKITGHN